jgi:hypothetical protein
VSRYHNIEKAHLEIAYDNGGINRDRSAEMATEELRRFLPTLPYSHERLIAIDAWLGGLEEEQLQTVCAGEEAEQDALLAKAPFGTGDLLNAIFDGVC